jgi:hypothetical protein
MRLEGLDQFKNPMTSGIELTTKQIWSWHHSFAFGFGVALWSVLSKWWRLYVWNLMYLLAIQRPHLYHSRIMPQLI